MRARSRILVRGGRTYGIVSDERESPRLVIDAESSSGG
jgi:hypothetical protein